MWLKLSSLLLLWMLSACSGEPQTGPVDIKWDRDNCDRCRMVLSEPHFATQVRYFPPGKRSRVAKFDDFGCAVLWLQDKPWQNDSRTEIWVADHNSGEWLDAKTASYVPRNNTPMAYGLGAQSQASAEKKTFQQAIKHIVEVEKRHNMHRSHGIQPVPEISQ